jgi:predicted PolB exonuclease-like 3'-5' exonuclease
MDIDIKKLTKGMTVEENFAVISVTKKQTSTGKSFLTAELSHPSGKITGKVWEENLTTAQLLPNKVFRISAFVDNYNNNQSLIINQAYFVDDEEIDNYVTSQPTLVFDIETAGKKFEDLEDWDKEYLLNTLQRNEEDKEKAKQKTALYPLYGQVVSIGLYCPEKEKGNVLTLGKKEVKLDDPKFTCKTFESEKELLASFWDIFTKFTKFVTFNGINFDLPFLQFRSAINQVKVPIEIKPYSDDHIDLMKKFSSGANYKLEALCRTFGITNPKEKGVSGLHVSQLFEEGKIDDIANYVSRDVVSTSQLYLIWKKYLAGKIII